MKLLINNFTSRPSLLVLFTLLVLIFISNSVLAQTAVNVPVIPKSVLEALPSANIQLELRELPSHLSYFASKMQKPSAISPFIIGGSIAGRGEYPEFTQIFIDGQDGFLYAICGGTLIASNKVLTAAHCSLEPTGLYYVVPGFYSFNDSLAGKFIALSSKNRHPMYNAVNFDYDIAVFTLVSNASTPKAKIYGGKNALAGQTSTVIGTGLLNSNTGVSPDQLRKVNTPIVSNAACNAVYGSGSITSRMICAGFSNNGLGACSGDSGGPLWSTVNKKRTQVGIVSFGPTACETAGVYTAYARTSTLASFVRQHAPAASVVGDGGNIVPIMQLLLLE